MWFKLATADFKDKNLGKMADIAGSWGVTYTLQGNISKDNCPTIVKMNDGKTQAAADFTATFTLGEGATLTSITAKLKSSGTQLIQVTSGTSLTIPAASITGDIEIIAIATSSSTGGEPETPVDPTLDSIAYGGKTYREIFINKNIMPNINNNVLLSNAANTVVYTQYKSEYPVTIKQSTEAETNYVPSYYMDVSGAESRYLQRDANNSGSDGAVATAGEIFFGGVNVKITDWTMGRVGINVGSNYTLAVADRVTNGYERLTAKITAAKDAGYFVGSTGKASLTGYINNPVLVRGSIFGSNMPSESEWTTLYNNYCEILCNNA